MEIHLLHSRKHATCSNRQLDVDINVLGDEEIYLKSS